MSIIEKCSPEDLVLLAGRLRGLAAQKNSAAISTVTLGKDDQYPNGALVAAAVFINESNDISTAANILAELAESKKGQSS